MSKLQGSCLCAAVMFETTGPLTQPSVCHCGQCRKQSGHVWSSTYLPETNLTLIQDHGLRWFAASDKARRGFCTECGSFLFWQHNDEDTISISMGAFDTPTGLRLAKHIFTADKGDYYDISDGLPQRDQ